MRPAHPDVLCPGRIVAANQPGSREHAAGGNGKRLETLIARLYWNDPKTYLAYGWGKPLDVQAQVSTNEAEMEFAKEIARERARMGFDPRAL